MEREFRSSCAHRHWKGKRTPRCEDFWAEELKISEHQIVLKHGQKSRDKAICIDGLSEEDMRRRLLPTTH
jgi:uncharacterized protein YggU (UPF0235/DUF167 family)